MAIDHSSGHISDLDSLMRMLDINVVRLTECLVSSGWRLSFAADEMPGLHYNIEGHGRIVVGEEPPIALAPHTLVIVPPGRPFRFEAISDQTKRQALKDLDGTLPPNTPRAMTRRIVAGDGKPAMTVICGCFRASYAASIELFSTLLSPIVEQFHPTDELGAKLKSVVAELSAPQVGMEAMTSTLIKQVLVLLLRRSLCSPDMTLERFSLLADIRVTRAFADMVARPEGAHSILTLAETAGLSRSVFMMRFTRAFGCSPMAALRELRMRRATNLLLGNDLTIEQIARAVGYVSRSSFVRAFQAVYSSDPSEYRAAARVSVRD